MPRTGSVFTLAPSTVAPAVAGTPASAADFNAAMADISQALTDSMVTAAPAFTSPAEFDGGTADAPGITFTGDLDTGIWHPAANQVGITVDGAVTGTVLLAKTTGVDVTGDLTVDGNLGITTDADVDGNLNVDGTLTVDGTSTFTGRITASAGVAGILATDLPNRVFIDKSAAAPTAITGDTNWHELTPVSDALTLSADNRVMLNVGPMPAQAGPTYGTGTIDGAGNPAQALFRIARTVGPAYNVWTDVGAMEAWETSSGAEQIPSFSFSVIDFPAAAGDYKYRVEGAVGAAGATMTITNIRLTGVVL